MIRPVLAAAFVCGLMIPMAADVLQHYRTTMIDQALNVADQNRDLPAAPERCSVCGNMPALPVSVAYVCPAVRRFPSRRACSPSI